MTKGYHDQELERMLVDLESVLVERKESLLGDAPSKMREAICAFANDLPGHERPGIVFVGVRDDGSPSGFEITDAVLRQLADIKTDGNIVPPPSLAVSKKKLRNMDVAVIGPILHVCASRVACGFVSGLVEDWRQRRTSAS